MLGLFSSARTARISEVGSGFRLRSIFAGGQYVKSRIFALGLSTESISAVSCPFFWFIGFDPENLAVGAVASYDQAAGIALGTIVGAVMVAIALAFGVTAVSSRWSLSGPHADFSCFRLGRWGSCWGLPWTDISPGSTGAF